VLPSYRRQLTRVRTLWTKNQNFFVAPMPVFVLQTFFAPWGPKDTRDSVTDKQEGSKNVLPCNYLHTVSVPCSVSVHFFKAPACDIFNGGDAVAKHVRKVAKQRPRRAMLIELLGELGFEWVQRSRNVGKIWLISGWFRCFERNVPFCSCDIGTSRTRSDHSEIDTLCILDCRQLETVTWS